MRESRVVQRLNVMPEESPVGASAAVIERCVLEDAEHDEVSRCIRRVGAQHHI